MNQDFSKIDRYIRRAATMLQYGESLSEIRDSMPEISDGDFYLIYEAGKLLAKSRED